MLLQQLEPLSRIVLPVKQQLVFDEFGARRVDDLGTETLVLQKLKKMEALL